MIYNTQFETRIYEAIKDSLISMEYDIVRVRLNSGKVRKSLQLMIERLDGKAIGIGDCEKVSKHVGILLSVDLDLEEITKGEYNLEVSSAGLDSPLTRTKDFEKAILKYIKLTTKMPIGNQRRFFGKLSAVNGENIELKVVDPENIIQISFDNILEAHLDFFYKEKKPTNRKFKKGVKKT